MLLIYIYQSYYGLSYNKRPSLVLESKKVRSLNLSKMVSVVKTMGVISIIMVFLVATTVGDDHPDVPCCDRMYAPCCQTRKAANITNYGKVVGRKVTVGKNAPLVSNHP